MALTDRLLNSARIQLPGATDPVLGAELLNVVDEFCREGWTWRETITVPFVAGQATYAITPVGTEIVHALSMGHATRSMDDGVFEFGSLTFTGAVVTAADVASGPFYVVAALAPAFGSTDPEALLPSDMWSEHHRALLSGLLGRMMLHPGKPYSNPTLGVKHRQMFNMAKADARHNVRTGGIPGAQQWRFPRHTR
jgi:hypothetical protein